MVARQAFGWSDGHGPTASSVVWSSSFEASLVPSADPSSFRSVWCKRSFQNQNQWRGQEGCLNLGDDNILVLPLLQFHTRLAIYIILVYLSTGCLMGVPVPIRYQQQPTLWPPLTIDTDFDLASMIVKEKQTLMRWTAQSLPD